MPDTMMVSNADSSSTRNASARSSWSTQVTRVVTGSSAVTRVAAQTVVTAGPTAAMPNTTTRPWSRPAPNDNTSTAATWTASNSQTVNVGSNGGRRSTSA